MQLVPQLAVTDDHEPGLGMVSGHLGRSLEKQVMGLDGHKPSDDTHQRRIKADSELLAQHAARVPGHVIEVEPEPDDDRLAAPDVQAIEI